VRIQSWLRRAQKDIFSDTCRFVDSHVKNRPIGQLSLQRPYAQIRQTFAAVQMKKDAVCFGYALKQLNGRLSDWHKSDHYAIGAGSQ
jgi:hypothetical protein